MFGNLQANTMVEAEMLPGMSGLTAHSKGSKLPGMVEMEPRQHFLDRGIKGREGRRVRREVTGARCNVGQR